eukprot:gb/GECG01013689.1/.p1 GENE.gb/GECG01013689.1/~~gb/GECG01013689.1/.p1  ORF type:complete len:170 (+),score=16.52 gb/GECG01013689.1/:1-510(+)
MQSVLAPTSSAQESLDDDTYAKKIVGCLQTSEGCRDAERWRQMPVRLATNVNKEEADVVNGVQRSEGDVTVPILSLGFMPTRGWKSSLRNPAGVRMIRREFTEAYDEKRTFVDERAKKRRTGPSDAHESVRQTAEMISGILHPQLVIACLGDTRTHHSLWQTRRTCLRR